ncbi:MAG: DUF3750 domain-containing protein [Patescibacteria group bacterium]
MQKLKSIESLIKTDKYQVFLFVGTATVPFNFAKHPWFVVNKRGVLSRWEVFWKPNRSKTSWGHLHKDFYSPLQGIEMFFFSNKYFWKDSLLLNVIEGNENSIARQMAEFIENSPQTYPYCYQYALMGPNSNTYVQWVLNKFPESNMRLPWNSFGGNKTPA